MSLSHLHVDFVLPKAITRSPSQVPDGWGFFVCGGDVQAPLLTMAEASYHAGVGWETIRQWIKRDHLPVAGRDERGRPLFRWQDVALAEKGRRDTGKSVPLRHSTKRGIAA